MGDLIHARWSRNPPEAWSRSVVGGPNEMEETLFLHGEQLICNGAAARLGMNIKGIHSGDADLAGEPGDPARIRGFCSKPPLDANNMM